MTKQLIHKKKIQAKQKNRKVDKSNQKLNKKKKIVLNRQLKEKNKITNNKNYKQKIVEVVLIL